MIEPIVRAKLEADFALHTETIEIGNVDVESDFKNVRNNEIHRLCDSPAKLTGVVNDILVPSLPDSLGWMLGGAVTPNFECSR